MEAEAFHVLLGEVLADYNTFKDELDAGETDAILEFVAEQYRGSTPSEFERSHPKEFSLLARIVAEHAPAGRLTFDERRALSKQAMKEPLLELAHVVNPEPRVLDMWMEETSNGQRMVIVYG